MSSQSDIANALVMASLPQNQAAQPLMPPAQSQNPFLPDPSLEAQAQAQGQIPMHPIVAAIANHLGLMNLLRARSNQAMTANDPNTIE